MLLLTEKTPTLLKEETLENNYIFWKFPKIPKKMSVVRFTFIVAAIVV